jgi:type III secretion protein F
MALNMDDVFQKLGEATESVENEITDLLENMDTSNTKQVLELQQYMQKWSITIQTQSNTVKVIGDGIKSTVQNIR